MNILALTAFAAAAALAPAVQAHGYLNVPLARQFCNGKELQKSVYIAGGNGSGDKGVPLGGVPGFCGDPFMDKVKVVRTPCPLPVVLSSLPASWIYLYVCVQLELRGLHCAKTCPKMTRTTCMQKDGVDGWTNFAGMPCEPQETYQAGGILSSHIVVPANHGGFFMLHVCDSTDLSQECFDKYPALRTCVCPASVYCMALPLSI